MRDPIFGPPPEDLVLVQWPMLVVRAVGVVALAILALVFLLEVV